MMPADDWFGDTMDWKEMAAVHPTFVSWAVQTHGPLPEGKVKAEDYDRLVREYLSGQPRQTNPVPEVPYNADLTSLTDDVLSNAPDSWTGGDQSESTQEIAVRYVRYLERKVIEAYGSLEPYDDEEVETPSTVESGRDHPLHEER